MRGRKKIVPVIAVVIVLFTMDVLVFPRHISLSRFFWNHARMLIYQRRVLLLCKTDHEALLKAGREILSQMPIGKRTRNGYEIRGDFPVPKEVCIPQIIQNLRPHAVLVSHNGDLTIEMHGGMDHFGVHIYPEDFKEPRSNFQYGNRELLPGLWYYDDGYLHNPEYDERVETLIKKYKGK
jgi:hypothetical protein